MNSYLLDTQVIIWHLTGSKSLPPKIKDLIENTSNEIYISIASFWEIAIKISISKLQLPLPLKNFIEVVENKQIQLLPIDVSYLLSIQTLPFFHKDPFDRLIISTAVNENLAIISSDPLLDKYEVERIW